MTVDLGLIEGPAFTIDVSGSTYSVACGGCGGGTWIDRVAGDPADVVINQIAMWTGEHALACMTSILEEELETEDAESSEQQPGGQP